MSPAWHLAFLFPLSFFFTLFTNPVFYQLFSLSYSSHHSYV